MSQEDTVPQTKPIDPQFLAAELDEMEDLEEQFGKERSKLDIVWRNVALFSVLHAYAVLGLYYFIFVAHWQTCLWAFFLNVLGCVGITAGAHRLWSHRSYKATTPVRVGLMLASTVAFQNDVIEWARDHRCHHKWTDTEADPHNARRGFFYSHIGWLLTRKTEQLKQKGAKVDLSDLFEDQVLVFQRKHYLNLVLLFCFALPTLIPVYFWNESVFVAFVVCALFRYTFTLNSTWLINSASHMFGYKPYDASISPVENMWTNILAVGEGGHNFHHSFPQDYRASELPYLANLTCALLDALAYFGLVYDLKRISNEGIERQSANKGDGTRKKFLEQFNLLNAPKVA